MNAPMKPLPTAITLACLFQVGFIVAGTLFTRLFINIGLRHNEALANSLPHKATIAWFVRSNGTWFFLVPLGCCLWAAAKGTREQGKAELNEHIALIIFLWTVALGILFLFSALSPWFYLFRD